jgi:hypothetical protein
MMRGSVLGGLLAVLAASAAVGWPLAPGDPSGNRVATGRGSFPRWQALTLATDIPVRRLVAFGSRRLAAVDEEGALWILTVSAGGLRVVDRYGDVAGADTAPVAVHLDRDRAGVALVGRDGRLVVWADGTLRSHDVGTSLSRMAVPVPVSFAGHDWDDLLAVASDGAVVLLGALPAAPRVVSRLEAHALPDAHITLDHAAGDGALEAFVLADATDRYAHGVLGDRLEAGSLAVIRVSPRGLTLGARHSLRPPAVFEDLVAISVAPGADLPAVALLIKSAPDQGGAVVGLGWKDRALVPVIEGPAFSQSHRWSHLVAVADLTGDGSRQVVAVRTPHLGGAVTAYRRQGTGLVAVAQAAGYASHVIGSRNLDQAVVADLDGNGRVEVIVPRQSRDALAALELEGGRFVERWSVPLRGSIESNLVAADLDGDGLLDLAVADRRRIILLLSVR